MADEREARTKRRKSIEWVHILPRVKCRDGARV